MGGIRKSVRIISRLLSPNRRRPSHYVAQAYYAATRIKPGLKRAFLFSMGCSLLLIGQSTFLSTILLPHAHAAGSSVVWPVNVKLQHWKIVQGYNTGSNAQLDHGSPQNYSQTYGLDLVRQDGGTDGQPVLSPVTGTVESSTYTTGNGIGRCVVVDLDGFSNPKREASLCHLDANSAKLGQHVTQGVDLVGTITSGAGHLHFNLRDDSGGSYSPVAFTGAMSPAGCDYPVHATSTLPLGPSNQYSGQWVSCQWPGGWWIGPTGLWGSGNPRPNGETISLGFQATDNGNSGVSKVDFTTSTDGGRTWNRLALDSTKTVSGTDVQYFAHFSLSAPTIISADVYANNTAYQLAPQGFRFICVQNVGCPSQKFAYWDGTTYGDSNVGGQSTSNPPSSGGCTPGQYQAAVFQDPNYGGPCVIKGIGTYADPTAIGLPNDSISSVKVGSGSLVTLCDNAGINSPCEWFTADDPDLSNNSLNTNTVSSMKVEGGQATTNCVPSDTQVAFFVDQNFQGSCTVRDVGKYDNAGALGLPDNTISSVKLGARANVRVCQNDGNNSPCDQFESDKANFNATLVEGEVTSSAEVTLKGGIALCSGTNGGGDCKWFGANATDETLKNLSDVGFDNRAQSIVYDPAWDGRYHIVLYVDQNQTGALFHAEHSVGDLLAPYDNNISSIKIYKIGLPGASANAPVAGTKFPASTTSVNLNFDGGSERHVQVWSDGGYYFDSNWTSATSLSLAGLAPGAYHWQVQARSVVGEGAWTPVAGFTINTPPRVQGGQLTALAGSSTSIQVNAIDDEADALTLTASGLPSFVTFTDNGGGIGTLNVAPGASVSGNYAITITASDGDQSGVGTVNLTVSQPQPVGYTAQYFNNLTLSGTPVLTRDEPAINNDWGSGSPDASVAVDNFSARWTKTDAYNAGSYLFTVTADDGVRLYVDNQLVIDKWIDQEATTYSTTLTFASSGNHTVKIEYYDSGWDAVAKFSSQAVATPTPPPAGSQTVTSQVAASSDDGEENASASMSLTSSDLELTCDTSTNPCPTSSPGKQTIGMRFAALGIPKSATINSAHIVFTGKEAQSETTNLTFKGQAADNAPTFTTASGNISSRSKTTAAVNWSNLPVWSVGPTYQTPDLSPIMQEIVNRAGWASGNAAAIIVTGLGHRTAWSFDGNNASAAKLVVSYTAAGTPTPPPSSVANGLYKLVNAGSNKALDVSGGNTADGTNVQIWTDTSGASQQWQVTQNADGTYKLVNPSSGKALDVNGGGTLDGTNVQIWTDNASSAQKWQIVQNADGTYKLLNPTSGKVLDVSGGNTADGTNVQIWTDNGSAAQKWQLAAVTATPPPPPPATSGTELLTAAWNITGNNGASELYHAIASNALAGKTTVRVTYNLHGLNALGGDASALIFDQNGWHFVSLSNYGQNGLNGTQTVDIPLSAFGLDLTQPVGTMHTRFWYGSAFTVNITSVQVL